MKVLSMDWSATLTPSSICMDVFSVHSSRWRCSPLKSGHYFYGPSFLFVFDVCGVACWFSCAVHSATPTFLIQSGVVRIRNEVRHGVACQTPFADNLSLAITHLGKPWETLLNPVVRRSQQVSFWLQRSWPPQTSSRTMNGRVNKVSVGL